MQNHAKLSVLDLCSYPEGITINTAFQNAKDLAQHVEKLGYHRYWLAEHHNLEGIASAATSILIAYIAENTKTIRVGSGGIMLPNHSPLIIAEQFGTLETLYPGRIDLGLGRAPGTDQLTMRALRRNNLEDDFAELISELSFYFQKATPNQRLKAIPGEGLNVPFYILGSSLYSARLAAQLGRPYAFAGHFAPAMMDEAFALYTKEFRPSEHLDKPYKMVGVSVIAAPTKEESQFLASSLYLVRLSLIRGALRRAQAPVENMDALWTKEEEQTVKGMMRTAIIGAPEDITVGLERLQERTGASEFIITSDVYDKIHRERSYELIKAAWPWHNSIT